MKTAKVFKQDNSQAVLLPKSSTRWCHVRVCLGKLKGELERNQPEKSDERDW